MIDKLALKKLRAGMQIHRFHDLNNGDAEILAGGIIELCDALLAEPEEEIEIRPKERRIAEIGAFREDE